MPSTIVAEKPVIVYRSSELEQIQERFNSPFGMLFLKVPMSISLSVPLCALTTSSSEETSNDGSSKLDPVYDEDEEDDE